MGDLVYGSIILFQHLTRRGQLTEANQQNPAPETLLSPEVKPLSCFSNICDTHYPVIDSHSIVTRKIKCLKSQKGSR